MADRNLSRLAVFIAALALVFSIWQGCETRKHNRLSLKPHLMFFSKLTPDDQAVGIFLQNPGLGPAFIEKFELFLDGKSIEDGICGWQTILKEVNLDPDFSWVEYTFLNPEKSAIEAGEICEILVIKRDKLTTERVEKFKKLISRIDIKITYESVYEEKFEIIYKKVATPINS